MRVEARKKTEIIMGKTRKEAPDFSKFVEEFLTWSQAQNKASTHKRYRVSSKPLLKYFRGKVSEIDMASVERFKVSRLKECSAAGVNRDLAALRYMMNFAIIQGYVEFCCLEKGFFELQKRNSDNKEAPDGWRRRVDPSASCRVGAGGLAACEQCDAPDAAEGKTLRTEM